MSILQLATVLIYVTSVLTSTVNDGVTSDQSPPPGLKKLFLPSQTETKNPTLFTETRSVNDNGTTPVSKPVPKEGIFTEGGRVISSSPQVELKSSRKPVDVTEEPIFPEIKLPPTPQEIPESHEGGKGIVARKGVGNEKTVGKEGVTYPEDLQLDAEKPVTQDQVTTAKNLPDVKKTPTTEIPSVKADQSAPVKQNASVKITPNDTKLDKRPETVGNRTIPTVILLQGHPNDTATHKHKPTSTTGEGDDDGKGMPSSPTKTEAGMPRKVDYIVPVVITIMATPVLGIAAFVLYTRGRDCWEKRHYRRMDFLIDGMYND